MGNIWMFYIVVGSCYYIFCIPRIVRFLQIMSDESKIEFFLTVIFLTSLVFLWPWYMMLDARKNKDGS